MFDRVRGILIEGQKILMIHRIKNGREYWVVPGGGREKGEDDVQALKREIKEETNFNVTVGKLVFSDEYNNQTIGYYLLNSFSGDLELGGPEKKNMNADNQYFLEWVEIKN